MNGLFSFSWTLPTPSLVQRVVVINCGLGRVSATNIAAVMDHTAQKEVLPDAFILQVYDLDVPELKKQFQHAQLSSTVKHRLKDRCGVYVVSHDGKGVLTDFFPKTSEGQIIFETVQAKYSLMTEAGLGQLFDVNKVLSQAPPGFAFVKPSGEKSTHFLKAENALGSSENVEYLATTLLSRLAPWLGSPDPEGLATIYVDSMAISSLAYVLREIYSRYSANGKSPNVESFHSYSGLKAIPRPATHSSLCIISASSSLKLEREWISYVGGRKEQVVTLLTFTDARGADNALYCTDKPGGWRGSTELKEDKALRELRILGESFDPEEVPIKRVQLNIGHQCTETIKGLASIDGDAVFRVFGGKSIARSRPRAFLVDQDLFLECIELQKWRKKVARERVPASCKQIVFQDDEYSEKFATRIQEDLKELGRDVRLVSQAELAGGTCNIDQTAGLVIVALVVGRGSKLLGVSRDLRNLHTGARYYLIGMQISDSERDQTMFKSNLVWSSSSAYIEVLRFSQFSSSGALVSSFSREAQFSELIDALKASDNAGVAERASRLLNPKDGFLNNTFLPSTNPELTWLELRDDFAFWKGYKRYQAGHHHATNLLVHLAGILQRARKPNSGLQSDRQLFSSGIQQVVVDPQSFLRFDDGILRAAILRCAEDSELDYSAHSDLSEQMCAVLREVIGRPTSVAGEASLEFALALKIGRLKISKEHYEALLPELHQAVSGHEFPHKALLQAMLGAGIEREKPIL